MSNEIIFVAYVAIIAMSTLIALRIGPHALISLMSVEVVLANLFVSKEILLCNAVATASDALGVGVALSLIVLQEFFGKSITRQAIGISFFCALVYTLLSMLHISYIPSPCDTTHAHFCAILSVMPRIMMASLGAYGISQWSDYFIFGALRARMSARWFAWCGALSMAIAQAIDTVAFTFLGLYGVVSSVGQVIVVSYIIKLITIVLLVPFLFYARYFVKNAHA